MFKKSNVHVHTLDWCAFALDGGKIRDGPTNGQGVSRSRIKVAFQEQESLKLKKPAVAVCSAPRESAALRLREEKFEQPNHSSSLQSMFADSTFMFCIYV